MRIVFMGTPYFSVPSLQALVKAGHDVCAVVTQPDRPKGRGHKLALPPVKEAALSLGIPVVQPEKVKEENFIATLEQLAPEVIVVVAFGQILPDKILAMPRYGCINLHASLLPKYRGAAPIHWSVINGETKTGNTTMLMDKGMDTGAMLLTNEILIDINDTTGKIHDLLSISGAQLLLDTLAGIVDGSVQPVPQNHDLASYAPKLTKEIELIDWSWPSLKIHNKIRGLNPWPAAYALSTDGRLKIFASRLSEKNAHMLPGCIAGFSKDGFYVSTGDGLLEITEVQPESRKRMPAGIFARGLQEGKEFFKETMDGRLHSSAEA